MKVILVVDDLDVNLDILCLLIKREIKDVYLVRANSVDLAVRKYKELNNSNYTVDLVIADVHMPILTGVDLYNALYGLTYRGKFCFLTADDTFKHEHAPVFYKPLCHGLVGKILWLL